MRNKKTMALMVAIVAVASVAFMGSFAFAQSQTRQQADATEVADSEGRPIRQIALTEEKANPDTVTVVVGSTLSFNAADGKPHSMSLGEGGEQHDHSGTYSSGEFAADEAWHVTFSEAGTYFFHDHLNPNINVLVVAYEQK